MEKWLAVYDTPNDRRRHRFAAILDDYGERVQYSVFEVIAETRHFKRLIDRLEDIVDVDEDSLRLYPLCQACSGKVLRIGQPGPEPWWEPEFYIV